MLPLIWCLYEWWHWHKITWDATFRQLWLSVLLLEYLGHIERSVTCDWLLFLCTSWHCVGCFTINDDDDDDNNDNNNNSDIVHKLCWLWYLLLSCLVSLWWFMSLYCISSSLSPHDHNALRSYFLHILMDYFMYFVECDSHCPLMSHWCVDWNNLFFKISTFVTGKQYYSGSESYIFDLGSDCHFGFTYSGHWPSF